VDVFTNGHVFVRFYRVDDIKDAVNYVIRRTPKSKSVVVHVDSLRKCEADTSHCWRKVLDSDKADNPSPHMQLGQNRVDVVPSSTSGATSPSVADNAPMDQAGSVDSDAVLPKDFQTVDSGLPAEPTTIHLSPSKQRPVRTLRKPARYRRVIQSVSNANMISTNNGDCCVVAGNGMASSSADDDRHPGSGSLQYNCSLCGAHFATLSGLCRHGILHHGLSFSKTGRVRLFPDNYTYYHQFKPAKHGQQQSDQRLWQSGKQPFLWSDRRLPRMLESTLPPGIQTADPLYLDSVLPLGQSDVTEDYSPADSDPTANRATDETALRQRHHGQGSATTDAIPRPASVRHCYVVTTPPTERASGRAGTADPAADPPNTGPSGTRVGRGRRQGLHVCLPFDPPPQDPSPGSRQLSGRLTPRPTEAHQHS
jgi:hypothetical protein